MDDVVTTFGIYRLLTLDRDPLTRGPTVEIAHEALLREWGRLLMLGLMAAGLANSVVYLVRPALMLQYNTEFYRRMNVPQPQVPAQFQSLMPIATFGFAILFAFGIAAALIHYRGAFKRPIEPPRNEATALP